MHASRRRRRRSGSNASGSLVKVVQRVHVKLVWTDLPEDVRVEAGLSADVTVLTK